MKHVSLKFAAFFLVITFLPSFLTQCCMDSCCGERGKGTKPFFNVNGLTSVSYRADTVRSTQDVYNQQPIHHRNYFCWLRAEVEYYGTHIPTHIGFGQSLMACSPLPPGDRGSEESISAIQIFSHADYDNALPAGSDLSTIFQISASLRSETSGLSFSSQDYKALSAFLATSPHAFYDACLRLSKAPTVSKKHTFRIEYTQTNGEKYTIQTPEITFQ